MNIHLNPIIWLYMICGYKHSSSFHHSSHLQTLQSFVVAMPSTSQQLPFFSTASAAAVIRAKVADLPGHGGSLF